MHPRKRARLAWLVTIVTLVLAAAPQNTAFSAETAAGARANAASCNGSLQQCSSTVLGLINLARARHGLPRLTLHGEQSQGSTSCAGAYGHSIAMARTGFVWHVNSHYPRASFPEDICVRYMHAGENVGQAPGGDISHDLQVLHHMMMAQPHDRATCATVQNHACNILSPAFRQVGIGVYYAHGRTWLTESFLG